MSTSTDRFSLSFFHRKWYNEEIKGKRVMNQSMPDKLILPQNTRLMGVFLGFIGGSLDVFCHIQYHSLVATQTGNILLLISDWHDSHLINTLLRFCSIIFFSLGFLFALHIKEYRKTAYWRVKMLLPLFIVTLILPFFFRFPLIRSSFYCFWNWNDDANIYGQFD